jgi:phosphoribosylaminoimidazolecarboxamide formyltransferase/IMP cyclohydrolase
MMFEKPVCLVSVSNREGLVELCKKIENKYSFLATSGTANHLREGGVSTHKLADYTGAAEILGGRVKTLHPKVFGGILSRRTTQDQETLDTAGISPIDVVICNLYPFRQGLPPDESIELIDIGGPSLIRAAAKNFQHVTVLVHPSDYESYGQKLLENSLTVEDRELLALKAFNHVAWYNIEISRYFSHKQGELFPSRYFCTGIQELPLRYGENAHQKAMYFSLDGQKPFFKHIYGKEVSFNNIADFAVGIRLLDEFDEPACAMIKHRSPCGVSENSVLSKAFEEAFATDSLSAFGGIAIFNRPIDKNTASVIMEKYVDGIIAPGYNDDALPIFKTRKKIILTVLEEHPLWEHDIVPVPNGFLIQDADHHVLTEEDIIIAGDIPPNPEDLQELLWGWKVVRHCKSNSVVLSHGTKTVGIGSGSPSRVDAVEFALKKAGDRANGSVLTSDAFFPFPDSIEVAAKNGIRAILAPRGSIRDKKSIAAANELEIPLIFSTIRGFRH